MTVLLSLFPITLMLCVLAAFVKLAARLSRDVQVSWKHCFAYALIIVVSIIAVRALMAQLNLSVHLAFGALFGLVMQISIGAWFFGIRAHSTAGVAIGWRGGARLSAVAFSILLVLVLVLFGVANVLSPHAQQ